MLATSSERRTLARPAKPTSSDSSNRNQVFQIKGKGIRLGYSDLKAPFAAFMDALQDRTNLKQTRPRQELTAACIVLGNIKPRVKGFGALLQRANAMLASIDDVIVRGRDGRTVTIRPVEAHDAEAIQRFIRGLS